MGQRLEAEARAKQAATLSQLKATLDHEEKISEGMGLLPMPIY